MILTDREYQYWLTRHCPRELCWVVAARLGEMISHENTKLFPNQELRILKEKMHVLRRTNVFSLCDVYLLKFLQS